MTASVLFIFGERSGNKERLHVDSAIEIIIVVQQWKVSYWFNMGKLDSD